MVITLVHSTEGRAQALSFFVVILTVSIYVRNSLSIMRGLVIGVVLFVLAQVLIWFQTNSQFLSPWARKNALLIALLGGTLISYIFIKATGFVVEFYDGQLWPTRFVSFATGVISFAFLTWFFMGEPIDMKTTLCLLLALAILAIQVLWR